MLLLKCLIHVCVFNKTYHPVFTPREKENPKQRETSKGEPGPRGAQSQREEIFETFDREPQKPIPPPLKSDTL